MGWNLRHYTVTVSPLLWKWNCVCHVYMSTSCQLVCPVATERFLFVLNMTVHVSFLNNSHHSITNNFKQLRIAVKVHMPKCRLIDLTTCDFYVWKYIKQLVHEEKSHIWTEDLWHNTASAAVKPNNNEAKVYILLHIILGLQHPSTTWHCGTVLITVINFLKTTTERHWPLSPGRSVTGTDCCTELPPNRDLAQPTNITYMALKTAQKPAVTFNQYSSYTYN